MKRDEKRSSVEDTCRKDMAPSGVGGGAFLLDRQS